MIEQYLVIGGLFAFLLAPLLFERKASKRRQERLTARTRSRVIDRLRKESAKHV